MAPSSTTTAARAPSRNSASIWLRESGVTFSELFASPETASVIDGPRSCLVFWLGTGVAGDDRKAASYEQPPSRLLVARSSWLAGFCSWGNAVNRCESFQSQGHQNMVTVIQQRFFFAHYGLTNHDLETYLSAALSAGGDYADLYFEYLTSTSLMVDESLVKSASQGISAGCGVRGVSGERTGYAYTDDLSPQRILHAARTAALIASAPAKTTVAGFQQKPARSLYPVALPSVDADITAKVELLMRADRTARGYDPRIKEVRASYADELRTILVVGSDGTFAEDSQPLARVNVSCIAKTDASSGRGTSGGGGRVALDFFFGDKTPEFFAKEAARQAILQLDAREAPAGDMEVVLGPGWPGVLLHEAVGIRRPDRQTRGQRKVHRGRQRHDAVAPRVFKCG